MAIAARENRKTLALCGKNGLEKGFQVPALYKHGVEAAFLQPKADLWCVAAREMMNPGQFRDIGEETMGVTRKEIDIPIEGDSEPCLRLVGRAGAMCEENHKLKSLRQNSK